MKNSDLLFNVKHLEHAFWISPQGRVQYITDGETHIGQVIAHPTFFGYNKEEIENIFKKHNEDLKTEGKAREEIILDLVKKGWVRIRKYNRPDIWSVNVPNLNNRVKDAIHGWASYMIKHGAGKYADVKLDAPQNMPTYSLSDLATDVLYARENIEVPKTRFKLLFEERYRPVKIKKYDSVYTNKTHDPFYDGKYWNHGLLFEKSLSVLYQHISDDYGFILGSAFRPIIDDPVIREKEYGVASEEENMERHNLLLGWLHKLRLKFIVVDGVWINKSVGIKDSELSVFVPYWDYYSSDEFLELAWHWTKKGNPEQGHFSQDAVLVKDPDPNYGKLFLLKQDGTAETEKGIFKPDQIAEIYTQFKKENDQHNSNHAGRTFVFEGVQTYGKFWSRQILVGQGHRFL